MNCEIVPPPPNLKRYLFIGCEVLFREVCWLSARACDRIDHVWLSQGLHDLGPERMAARIQETIDAADETQYDAILLGFGLCNNGVLGLRANGLPLVLPRAHDCITLFLGSRERYRTCFDASPGTYFLTTGWLERDDSKASDEAADTVAGRLGLDYDRDALVEQYGEENADFVAEMLGDMVRNYNRIAYIRFPFETDDRFLAHARRQAEERGWAFECLEGDLSLLQRLLNGEWETDMLVVPPGASIAASYDHMIVMCKSCG